MTRKVRSIQVLFPALLLAALGSHAQTMRPEFRRPEPQYVSQSGIPGLPTVREPEHGTGSSGTGSKSTAMVSRLIIVGSMSGTAAMNLIQSDSTTMGYIGRLRDSTGIYPYDTVVNYLFDTLGNQRQNYRYLYENSASGRRIGTVYQLDHGAGFINCLRYRSVLNIQGIDSLYIYDTANAAGVFLPNILYHYQYVGTSKLMQSYVYSLWNIDSLAYVPSYRYTYSYDAAGNMLTQLYERYISGIWNPSNRRTNTYNAGGKLEEAIYESYNGSVWQRSSHVQYTYDAASNLIREENESIQNSGVIRIIRREWSFDPAGHQMVNVMTRWAAASGWTNGDRTFYTYDANGFQSGEKYQRGSGTNWVNADSTAIVNDATGEIVSTTSNVWNNTGNVWTPQVRETWTYFAPNLSSNVVREKYDPVAAQFVNFEQEGASYNSYNQPAFYYKQIWNGAGWTNGVGAKAMTYYYEEFDAGLKVRRANASREIPVTLAPVPARNSIAVTIPFEAGYSISGQICDLNGRVCSSWQSSGGGTYHRRIDLREFAAGSYILSIRSGSSTASRLFTVIR